MAGSVKYDEKNTADSTASFYHYYKWIYLWIPERENIPGRVEICLCPWTELLFLSGGVCLMTDWRASGAA